MLNSLVGIIASSGGAANGAAYESIASATGTGSSGTITFSSIPSTYTSLQIRYNAISTGAGGQIMRIQFNSDTGTNYTRHALYGLGATVSAFGLANTSFITPGDVANGISTVYPTTGITDIQDYASTTRYKTVRDLAGRDVNAVGGAICLNSGVWMSTSAITSISFYILTDSFTTSTTVSLYGIKGA